MDSTAWFPVEILLLFGPVIALCAWDLWRTKRDAAADARHDPVMPPDAASGKAEDTEPSQR